MDGATSRGRAGTLGGKRLASGYLVVAALLAVAAPVSIHLGTREHAAPAVAGVYAARSESCLGSSFTLLQSGQFVNAEAADGRGGRLRLRNDRLRGRLRCADGATAEASLGVSKTGKHPNLSGSIGRRAFTARFASPLAEAGAAKAPLRKRSGEETFGRLMLAIAAVILAARLVGTLIGRVGQPQVMGEVLAGILLGPTLVGKLAPGVQSYLFPADIIPLLSGAAQIGLAFYLFLVGMELDPRLVRERIGQAAFISNTSVVFPLVLGLLVAVPLYRLLAPPVDYLPFALFVGVAMSITAFPVLARILTERRMLKQPVGALAMASAAVDDVSAWGLLALATAIASAGSGLHALVVVGLAGAFTAAMILVGRRLLSRVSTAYDEVGQVPPLWIGVIFVAVLLSAFTAQQIGVAAIFGAFIMGLIMPRHGGITDDVSRRIEDFVVIVLLPLFFVVTGLRTDVGSLDRPILWLLTLALILVAVAGKWIGAMAAAAYGGFGLRDSAVIGALMNTRGLTELIVLNIGLDLGLMTRAMFTMLVVMALVTTFMAGPALRLLDPRGELAAAPGEDLRVAEEPAEVPAAPGEHAIVVAPQDGANFDALLAIAEPLAQSRPARELVLARLLQPSRVSAGVRADERALTEAARDVNSRREALRRRGLGVRALAFTTPAPAEDLLRLAAQEDVDLVLVDGRRPLLGAGVPRGEVGRLLQEAACDVAVLVESQGVPQISDAHPVLVPFGGAEHDWAALELAAWIAHVRSAPLRLLGAASSGDEGGRDASRLLANASMLVQQLTGVGTEPVLTTGGRDVIRRAEGAGLLVVGLSERWRSEGLGPLRSEMVKSAPAPTLLVRRGTRPGALSPRDEMTRFRWSSIDREPI